MYSPLSVPPSRLRRSVVVLCGVAVVLSLTAIWRDRIADSDASTSLALDLSRDDKVRPDGSLAPPQQFRLLHSSLHPQYTAGDVLVARVVGPSLEVEDRSWLRMVALGDQGQRATGYPMPAPYYGWVLPLLEPGNWTLDVRLVDFDVPDIVDRDNQRVPLDPSGEPPAWAKCYNESISDGEHAFEVLPAIADVPARLRENVARLPSAIRTADIDSAGTLANTSCSSRSDVLAGSWSSAAEGGHFQAFSGCDSLSTARDAVPGYIARSPETTIKWIRFIGDSNTRMLVKDNFPWINLLLPPGLYPVEPPNGRGTPPCIYGFNPVHGKDEQYLCVLHLGPSKTPTLISYEWFSLNPLDSSPLEDVYPRSVRQAFASLYSNSTILNERFTGRFGRVDPAYNVTHTVETLLAPFPDLLDLEYADHTLVSFGSHRTETTTAEWQAHLDSLTSMWPRTRQHAGLARAGQPEREHLTLINTTPIDAVSIPEKFGSQHLVRNNRRIEARNALLQQHLATSAQLQSSQRYPPAQAFLFDLYGMLLPLVEVQHDPVHSMPWIYRAEVQLFLDHVVRRG
ncbi:hypothetical protein Rhopal_006355-T1 [Rhodotorula paludigena]|uniref:Uncharacterized protein n=1 Tax=Rhodotorula paludigena TaxID=86838 RepID=A0AAV5GXR4_9BASI|nr:hypothetical protein Rhopal_006355-T1 [Rhodotorula paludigena]